MNIFRVYFKIRNENSAAIKITFPKVQIDVFVGKLSFKGRSLTDSGKDVNSECGTKIERRKLGFKLDVIRQKLFLTTSTPVVLV